MKLANLSSNIMALVVFYLVERLSYILDLQLLFFHCRALCRIWNGNENGNKIVRPIILIVLVLLFIKL